MGISRRSPWACAPRPIVVALAGRERHQDASVSVIGRKEIRSDVAFRARLAANGQLLIELAHAPFNRHLDRILSVEAPEADGPTYLFSEEICLLVTRQLENPSPQREDSPLHVTDDHAGAGPRVVVLEQLE